MTIQYGNASIDVNPRLIVVENWFEELKHLVRTNRSPRPANTR